MDRNKEVFGNLFQKIKHLEDLVLQLEVSQESGWSQANEDMLKVAKDELDILFQLEGNYWKQKANLKWAMDGDRNTKFSLLWQRLRLKEILLARFEMTMIVGWIPKQILADVLNCFFLAYFRQSSINLIMS